MTEDEAQDLQEFVRTRSPEAFERLTKRHAGLVYAVCLRRLGRKEDAEEASQAVFLALAQKASSVQPERLASWLHGAALRAATFVVRTRTRRAHYEKEAARMNDQPKPDGEASWEQIQPHLDAGIQSLPAKLREAVVRFYLQNRSRSEVARELGVPEGTVASRVSAGLERLRRWYGGIGVTATGAGFALLLSSQAHAAAPASLVASLPALAAAGTSGAAASGAPLVADGILQAMLWAKVKTVVAGVCMATALVAGGGLAVYSRTAAATPPPASTVAAPGAWTSRALPGPGRCAAPSGGSELRAAFNPSDGRIYFCGGRYTGVPYTDRARNEIFSYSIAEDNWRLEYPYRGPAGEVQPSHPSADGWAYDTKRKVFWLLSGGNGQAAGRDEQTEGATLVRNRIMTFDPERRRWDVPEIKQPRLICKFAQYDPVKDQLVSFAWDGARRLFSLVYDISADTWIETQHLKDPSGKFIGEMRVDAEYSALDVDGRLLWVIEPLKGVLLRYNLDDRVLTSVGETPVRSKPPGGGWAYESAMPVWDPGSRVLLWPQIHSGVEAVVTLYAYRPETGVWENRGAQPSQGAKVIGNCAVFDPRQRALLLIGGQKHRVKELFLYR